MGLLSAAPPDLTGLYSIFGDPVGEIPHARFVRPEEVPEPEKSLLAHDHHMTVTMEKYHGGPVSLGILKSVREGENWYARKIVLKREDRVVMFGIMRFNFEWCDEDVRERIIEAKTPLGRILIENEVLRRISTHALMKIRPNEEMRKTFAMGPDAVDADGHPRVVYGRLATIFCNEEPAVDLLEVAAPAS